MNAEYLNFKRVHIDRLHPRYCGRRPWHCCHRAGNAVAQGTGRKEAVQAVRFEAAQRRKVTQTACLFRSTNWSGEPVAAG